MKNSKQRFPLKIASKGGYGANGLLGTSPKGVSRFLSDHGINYSHTKKLRELESWIEKGSIFIFHMWNESGKIFAGMHYITVFYWGKYYFAYNYYSNRNRVYCFESLSALLGGGELSNAWLVW